MKKSLDFIGIGAQKAGSSWLSENLKKHPDINLYKKKEIEFFNDRYSFYQKLDRKNYRKGIKWYLDQLKLKSDKINGEISPDYIWDEKCAKRIKKDFPDVKIIAILRNPVKRAQSQYLFASQSLFIASTFEEAVKKFPGFIERGLYYKQLKRYYNLFPKKQIKIILFEDIVNNPEKVIKDIQKYLGARIIIPEGLNNKVGTTKYPKHVFINKIFSSIQRIKTTKIGDVLWKNKLFLRLKRDIGSFISRWNMKNQAKPKINPNTKEYLLKYFKKDINNLEKLIKRDLSQWKK